MTPASIKAPWRRGHRQTVVSGSLIASRDDVLHRDRFPGGKERLRALRQGEYLQLAPGATLCFNSKMENCGVQSLLLDLKPRIREFARAPMVS